MMTYNITVDLDNPSTQKLEVPANMPYAVRLNLTKAGLAHAAWDGDYGVGNVIPTGLNYEAKFSNGKWLNSADAWKDGFFAEEEGGVEVDEENPNLVTLNCSGRDVGSDGVKLLINPTDTNWESIPEADETIGDGDADPRAASRIEIVLRYMEKEGCRPAYQDIIEMTGSYVDGEEFSFSIAGVENQIS